MEFTEPHYISVENSILSIMLNRRNYLIKGCNELTAEHFDTEKNKKLFELILKMHSEKKAVDFTTVAAQVSQSKIMSVSELAVIQSSPFFDGYYKKYTEILEEYRVQKKLYGLANNIIGQIGNKIDTLGILSRTETEIRKIKGIIKSESTSNVSESIRIYVESVLKNETTPPAFLTGYNEIDKRIYGFNRGDYIVIGARTSMGKTAFALNLIANNKSKGCKAFYVSIEMSKKQLSMRLLSLESEVSMYKLTRGLEKTDDERKRVAKALSTIENYHLIVDDSGYQTALKIRSKAEELKESGLDVIVIDHIGLVRFEGKKNRYEGLTELSADLKTIAKELDVVIVVLCQLNRESVHRQDKKPNLGDIRDSGAVEQDADLIILLHSDDYYDPLKSGNTEITSQIIVAKDRNNGGLGTTNLQFFRDIQKFKVIDPF